MWDNTAQFIGNPFTDLARAGTWMQVVRADYWGDVASSDEDLF